MRTVPTCAAICSLSIAALSAADVFIFDNSVTYAGFCNDVGIVRQSQDLSQIAPGGYIALTGGNGDFSWNLSAPNGVFLDNNGIARTQQNADKLTLSFASNSVFAVGGFFFNVDSLGANKTGIMRIKLSDGTILDSEAPVTTGFGSGEQPYVHILPQLMLGTQRMQVTVTNRTGAAGIFVNLSFKYFFLDLVGR